MKKSRQNSHCNQLPKRKARSVSLNVDSLGKSSFITKFEGKINVVTRKSGLRGVLMKSFKINSNNRYKDEENTSTGNSRVKTQVYQSARFNGKIDNTISYQFRSQQLKNKENVNKFNFKETKKIQMSQPTEMKKIEQKIVTPFHLPRLNKLRCKKQQKVGKQKIEAKKQKKKEFGQMNQGQITGTFKVLR